MLPTTAGNPTEIEYNKRAFKRSKQQNRIPRVLLDFSEHVGKTPEQHSAPPQKKIQADFTCQWLVTRKLRSYVYSLKVHVL